MTNFWGDESWRDVAYQPSPQGSLFGETALTKQPNKAVADAFRSRLRENAGFKFVAEPMPMRNSAGSIVYYLFFASPNETANRIATEILRKHAKRAT